MSVLLLASLTAGAEEAGVQAISKNRIAVLPLKAETLGLFTGQQDEMYQKVSMAFFQTKRFEMVERAQAAAVLGEGKFQSSGLVDDASAVALGNQLGVRFVVLGSYTGTMTKTTEVRQEKQGPVRVDAYPAKVTLSLRMVNVETGKLEEAFHASGAANGADPARSLHEVMRDVGVKLDREVYNKFPLSGYVIQVLGDGREAVIDLGKKDGVAVGDKFHVVERGPDIVHPVTGKVIKGQKKHLTELKVLSVDEETAKVKISGDKVPLKVGLVLESAPKKAGFWEKLSEGFK
jgi:hypothetical protein